jgi:hypothetical protein
MSRRLTSLPLRLTSVVSSEKCPSSLVVDFGHSDTESEDDEEKIDFPAPDDPPGALAAAPFGSSGGGDGGDGKDGANVLWAR